LKEQVCCCLLTLMILHFSFLKFIQLRLTLSYNQNQLCFLSAILQQNLKYLSTLDKALDKLNHKYVTSHFFLPVYLGLFSCFASSRGGMLVLCSTPLLLRVTTGILFSELPVCPFPDAECIDGPLFRLLMMFAVPETFTFD